MIWVDKFVLIGGVLLALDFSKGCDFPEFLQNTASTKREWRGHIKNQNNAHDMTIKFRHNVMSGEKKDKSGIATKFSKVCVEQLPNNTFLTTHTDTTHTGSHYSCVQVIRIAKLVIRFKFSKVINGLDRQICSGVHLKDDPWLFVNHINMHKHSMPCSMKGGYSMQVFDEMRQEIICGSYKDETRLESECLPGESLKFIYRHAECVPPGLYMYSEQQVLCLAVWRQGKFTFNLVVHNFLKNMWLFRYPTNADRAFHAYLLKDIIMDTGHYISVTKNFLLLILERDPPRSLGSLCQDGYDICTKWSEPCYHTHMRLMCAKRCKICNSTTPSVCSFSSNFLGDWVGLGTHSGSPVTISSGQLSIKGQQSYHCVDWGAGKVTGRHGHSQVMLVRTFNNGCAPRYTCAKMKQRSSSVFHMHLSETKTWPFIKKSNDTIDCRHFSFTSARKTNESLFKGNHFVPLVKKSGRTYTDCKVEEFRDLHVYFKNGVNCSASLMNEGPNKLTVNYTGCSSHTQKEIYSCLDSDRFMSAKVVLTEKSGSPTEIKCWLFPRKDMGEFYMVEAGECNEMARWRPGKRHFDPMATFKVVERNDFTTRDVPITPITPPINTDSSNITDNKTPHGSGDLGHFGFGTFVAVLGLMVKLLFSLCA